MKDYLILFDKDVKEKSRSFVGEKAYNLSKIPRSKIYSIPKWFVLTTTAFDYFLISNGKKKYSTHKEVIEIIKSGVFPKDLEREIMQTHKMLGCKFVAVRSSSRMEDRAKSFAGVFTTTIGVKKDKLLVAIKSTWLSALREDNWIGMGVIVQELIESETSGVAFTNSTTKNLVVEAVFGQGESLVSGRITPDYYSITPNGDIFNMDIRCQTWMLKVDKGNLVKTSIASKSLNMKIEPNDLKLLNSAAKFIQNKKSGSRDIEFAIQDGKLFILQDRPGKKILDRKVKLNEYKLRAVSLIFLPRIIQRQNTDSYKKTKIKPRSISIFKKNTGFFHKYVFVFENTLDFFKLKEFYLSNNEKLVKDLKSIENNFAKFQTIHKKISNQQKLSAKSFDLLYKSIACVYSNFTLLNIFFEVGDREIKKIASNTRKLAESSLYLAINVIESFLSNNFPSYLKFLPVMEKDDVNKLIGIGSLSIKRINELENRLHGVFLFENKIYTINKLESVLKKNYLEIVSETRKSDCKFLTGSVVYPGIVRGKVRVIKRKQDYKNLKKGEILVVHMTYLNMLEAIKICSAIVTDEGGVLCHAAIHAREYKKPCIVGTQAATSFLRTGDKVTVNTKTNRITKNKS